MIDFFNSIGNWFLNNWQPIATTIAIIFFGLLIVKIILAIVKRQFSKTKMEKTVQSFILSILRFVLYLILIVAILSSLGISITGLTVVISAVSLAISLALQDSLKNLVNGFIIISTKLIKEGDWVEIAGKEGTVKDVRMLYTVLQTADNKRITIPNLKILNSEIVNYNVNKTRRLDLNFDISYDSNTDRAKEIINEVIDSCENILLDPKPSVELTALNASSLTITAKVWVNASDYWSTKWYLLDNAFNELKRNEITIPFNQLEVALVDPNKKSYIRETTLVKAESHKIKDSEEDDIFGTINKKFKKQFKKKKSTKTKAE